ncbi:MAG TPA: flagellar biosynthetic protein FliO [Bacillota bacterium]|jgi:flagellar biogenesis protein FliO|nr:flagellar biosynthetic protein FliO [Bacillota bacterium]HOL10023.1 flagellar biosynthetic protein FliO [Bacillota bacterium]HPO97773.1 flagellar biosynthetic protein FliO [Bacillota bacterium]
MRRINRFLWFYPIVVVLFLLLLALPLYASSGTTNEIVEDTKPEFGGQWIWALFSLIIVVFLAYWVSKLVAGKYGIAQAKHIKVAESLCLGPNRHLYLLLVDKNVMLVGATEHGLSLLKELPDPELYKELEKSINNSLTSTAFKDILSPLMGANGSNDESVEYSSGKERLRQGLATIKSWRRRR